MPSHFGSNTHPAVAGKRAAGTASIGADSIGRIVAHMSPDLRTFASVAEVSRHRPYVTS